ncbi:6219_t:CDS:2, partial [Scutellospora calospora]
NNITEYPKDVTKLIDTAAWIPPTCGLSAILVGSMFPLADYWFMRKPQEFQREWRTGVMYILVANGIYSFTHADFFGVRSWIPCILYSSCVCFGTIGRQLMIVPEDWYDGNEQNKFCEADCLISVKGE